MTNNLQRRIYQHKNKFTDGFTNKYGLDRLVYFETHQFVDDAIKREKNLKKWKREWKINLIIKDNPQWQDLATDWQPQ